MCVTIKIERRYCMNIVVYCASNDGDSPVYLASAKAIGEWIVKEGHQLVYGGGNVGLMKVVADTVLAGGQPVIGVMPHFIIAREIAHPHLTEMIAVETMAERKTKMLELGDVYIALAGGPGTLEEISEAISLQRLNRHNNPCVLINTESFYTPLQTLFMDMVTHGFLEQRDYNRTLFTNSISEMNDFIKHFND